MEERRINIITKYTSQSTRINSAAITGSEYSEILVNRTIENLTLTQDETIMAWEHIQLGNNINTNNFTLTVISGGAIDLGEYEFNPNIELKIDYPIACHRNVLQQTEAEIANFCGNSVKYNPSFTKNSLVEQEFAEKEGQFSMLAYPNPFNEFVRIDFELAKEEVVTMKLLNVLGQEINTIFFNENLDAGKYTKELQLSPTKGIYILSLQTETQQQTIRLIRQ